MKRPGMALCAALAAMVLAFPAQAAQQSAAIKAMLARRITVRKERQSLWRLRLRLYREHGFRTSAPRTPRSNCVVKLRRGTRTLGEVLREAAGSAWLDLEVIEHRGHVVACFWERPDKETMAKLEKFTASKDETDRCIAARWLPVAGSKRALTLALKLLADRSRRVQLYAKHYLSLNCPIGFLDGCHVSPISLLAPPGTGKALAEALDAKRPHRKYAIIMLAGLVGDPVVVPALGRLMTRTYEQQAANAADPNKKNKIAVDWSAFQYACIAAGRIGGPEAERLIVEAVEKMPPSWRSFPVSSLGLLGTPKASARLVKLLKANNALVRRSAAIALGQRGNVATIRPLTAFADDTTMPRSTRYAALRALIRIGTPEALAPAIQALRDEKDPKRQDALCMMLCRQPAAVEAISALAAESPGAAVVALGLIGSEKAVPVLISLLKHEKKYPRSRAALALGGIGGDRAVKALIERLRDDDVDHRCSAAQALGDAGDTSAVEHLRETLKDKDPRARMLAARALGKLGSADDIGALLAAAKAKSEKRDPYGSAGAALQALGHIGGPRAAKELLAVAKQGSAHAAYALLSSRAPDCIKATRDALTGDDAALTQALLGMFGRHRAYPRLRRLPLVAMYAVERLLTALRSPNAPTRLKATERVQDLGDPRCVPLLMEIATADKDAAARSNAVLALDCTSNRGFSIIDPLCTEALVEVLKNDEKTGIRFRAASMLRRLGLTDRPDVAEEFKKLYKKRRR